MPRPKSWTLLGGSERMGELRRRLERYAKTPFDVLVTGPRGSGKELAAREIHDRSRRKNGPYVAVDFGALPETLVESELFGHEAGSFTGASGEKPGLVEIANGGTLFLDEIANMSVEVQAKLLRFLEDRRVRRVGGRSWKRVDVRVIAASNRILETATQEGHFLPDLYDRLNVLRIEMPGLEEHREDIGILSETFLRRIGKQVGRTLSINDEAQAWLCARHYPGNVRELRNLICRMTAFGDSDTLDLDIIREVDPQWSQTLRETAGEARCIH